MKFARLSSNIQSFSEVNNPNLLKVKLWIQHDGANKNRTKFSLNAIEKAAKESLRNIPILAYIKRDSEGVAEDFDQHNMIQKVVETKEGWDLVTTYLERPIGVIPSETEISFEEKEGRTYLCATGYIWKRYANEGYDIIMEANEKGVSMEIEIHQGKKDSDGLYDVLDYSFLGVTCLGDDVEAGMHNTTIMKYSSSKQYKKELEDIYKEIFTLENGKENIMPEQIVETVEVEEVVEPAVEETVEEPTVEETEIVEEETTTEPIIEVTQEVAEEIVEEIVEEPTVEEEVVEIEEPKVEEFATDVEETVEPVVEEEVVEETIEEPTIEEDVKEETPSVEELLENIGNKELELNSLKETLASYMEELEVLRKFKAEKDEEALKIEVENIISQFATLEEAEIEGVKTKVLTKEISTDEFKKELFCILGMKSLKNNDTYSAKKEKTVSVARIIPVEKSETVDKYDGLLKKHNLV